MEMIACRVVELHLAAKLFEPDFEELNLETR